MNASDAINAAYRLQQMWVGKPPEGRGYDLDRIHASIMQDFRYRRDKPQFAGVVREMRGHLVLLGKVRKALA